MPDNGYGHQWPTNIGFHNTKSRLKSGTPNLPLTLWALIYTGLANYDPHHSPESEYQLLQPREVNLGGRRWSVNGSTVFIPMLKRDVQCIILSGTAVQGDQALEDERYVITCESLRGISLGGDPVQVTFVVPTAK